MLEFLKDLWDFMRVRKKFWLAPIIIVLLLLGVLIVFVEGDCGCTLCVYAFLMRAGWWFSKTLLHGFSRFHSNTPSTLSRLEIASAVRRYPSAL